MKLTKKIGSVCALALSLLLLGSCGDTAKNASDTSTQTSTEKTTKETANKKKKAEKVLSEKELNALELPQLNTEVAENESLVEIETTEGNIKVKLFPEQAPKAVKNFISHAKDNYYNDTTFHRVIKDFMIQGGDPKGDVLVGKVSGKNLLKQKLLINFIIYVAL